MTHVWMACGLLAKDTVLPSVSPSLLSSTGEVTNWVILSILCLRQWEVELCNRGSSNSAIWDCFGKNSDWTVHHSRSRLPFAP